MDPTDHDKTSSSRSSQAARRYRKALQERLKRNKWRDAMALEIRDIRRLSREIGDPKKYNEAMLEMLEYFKCLQKNGLLK
ncbi:hypothetical protein EJD96_19290 [Herbaspirillum seropedicae]|uniref:hypothetical protein n=1 Tax=Herbaspirillum seropedicae TaxID=964 RepID=UPI00111E2478|nr:hypothetical protein [Herbaspirillum seropedicae]QDD66157.1 hypothetical protein EJD96_19290 [Herbaspirillum seropedicae]